MPAWLTSRFMQALILLGTVGMLGWGVWRGVEAIETRGYERAEAKYLRQLTEAKSAALDRYDMQNRNMLRLSEQLITAKTTIDAQTKKLQERANDVSTRYRPQPDAALQPVPGWIVTRGWVCDYNRAIGYGQPDDSSAVSGDAAATCAADPFAPSDVGAREILVHHEEYGGYCRKLEKQVNVLLDHIDFLEGRAAGK